MSERTEEQITDEIGALLNEIMVLRHPDDPPFLKGWAAATVIESVGMAERGTERSEYVNAIGQSIITTIGLHTVAVRHTLDDDD